MSFILSGNMNKENARQTGAVCLLCLSFYLIDATTVCIENLYNFPVCLALLHEQIGYIAQGNDIKETLSLKEFAKRKY